MNFELRHSQAPAPLLSASQGSDLYGKGSDILLIPHIEIVAGQVDGFLLEKRPHSGMSDEELEKLSPWSDEARVYCGYTQQTAFV